MKNDAVVDFDPDDWQSRCAQLEEGGLYPDWRLSCLADLGRLAPELLAADEAEEAPAFDMTYPH